MIAGDFDSLRKDVRDYYKRQHVLIEHSADQESTDFMKCVAAVKAHFFESFDLLVIGGLGGRVDQSFHSLHHLYLSYKDAQQCVYLYSSENVSFLLPPGHNSIETPTRLLGKTCGIIPLGGTAHITTGGLEWDVMDWETGFGSRVSTSNHILEENVSVVTDQPVLFTAELRSATNPPE